MSSNRLQKIVANRFCEIDLKPEQEIICITLYLDNHPICSDTFRLYNGTACNFHAFTYLTSCLLSGYALSVPDSFFQNIALRKHRPPSGSDDLINVSHVFERFTCKPSLRSHTHNH